MGLPIVKVASGGLPVTIATTGGVPCTEATNGFGVAVTQSTTGGGLAVTGFTFGPTIQLSANSVLETAAVNTTVGTLSVSAGTTGTPTFTMVTGGSTFNILGTALRTSVLLDFETTAFYSITVAVSGVSPTVANQTFTIIVVDVAEPVIILTGTTVTENSTAGTNIGVLSLANSFTGTPTYTLVDSSSGKVTLSGANLNVLGAIDFETTPTFNITVSVSGITPATTAPNKVFTIVVLDVVESATATWNPSDKEANITLSGGNLTVSTSTDPSFVNSSVRATASASTGKYYCELTLVTMSAPAYLPYTGFGCSDSTRLLTDNVLGGGSGPAFGMGFDGQVYDYTTGGSFTTIAACPVGSTIGMAVDFDNHRVWWRIITGGTAGNWNSSGTANPATNTGGFTINALMNGLTMFPSVGHVRTSATTSEVTTANFGATTYAAAAPSGFSNWGGGGAVGTTKNIVTDYGAVGDAQWAQATLSITTNVLTSATAIWPSSTSGSEYIGKSIVVGMAGSHSAEPGGGSVLLSTITGWSVGGMQITLANNASWPLSSEPNVIVAWGTINNTAFDNFRTAYQGQAVTLTIPAGNYLIASGNFGPLFDGIKNITVNATGATICGGAFQLGSSNQSQWYGHSAYTASVSAGASSVTLSTHAYVSRFTVGTYALMTGFGLQYGGFPSNHQRFEYVFITAIDSDSGSPTYGKITFLSPLVNSYFSTWPLFLDETGTTPPPENGNFTSGGPATLYALSAKFDHTSVINGLTIAHHPQMGMSGLNQTLNNCTFPSIWGPHVTVCKAVTLNTCLGILCTMEVDKLITAFTMNGCDWGGLSFQSASVSAFIADATVIRFSVTGTPFKTTIRNGSTVGTISAIGILTPGARYGYCNELIVTSSQVQNFSTSSPVIIGGTSSSVGVNTEFTMSGGVITIPLSYKAFGWIEQWPVIGAKIFFSDPNVGVTFGSFTITDVTYDATNVYVTTTATGGWPARSYNPSYGLRLIVHPAPICTFTSVTGCPEVVDLSNAGAAGLPLYSYSKRTYNGSVATMDYWQVWGRVKKVVVNVTQAYTGVSGGAVTLALGINVSNQMIKMSDYSDTTWAPAIDLKKTGTRTFDATANTYPVTWSSTAVAAADTLPGQTFATWAPGNFRPSMTDVSTEAAGVRPVFSIEVITDQG